MKLTENECSEALTRLLRPYYAKVDVQNVYHSINKGHSIEDDSNLLTLLIMEYFDNPPLKFEELKEKTWYWYELSKSWIYLFKPLDWEPVKGLRYGERIINHSVEGYYMDFKEGTLFRKEVQE